MRIEHAHTHAQGSRLAHHTLDQGRFPGPCFADNVEVIAEILPSHAERLQHNLSGMVDMADPELYIETLLLHNVCRVRPPPDMTAAQCDPPHRQSGRSRHAAPQS